MAENKRRALREASISLRSFAQQFKIAARYCGATNLCAQDNGA
jgi:hypothetical protein